MKRITAYLRPHTLDAVKTTIAEMGISGLTVADARGAGNSEEPSVLIASQWVRNPMPLRARLMVVVEDDLVEPLLTAIQRVAHTGRPGDGKIFVEALENAIRIRTNERGETAV